METQDPDQDLRGGDAVRALDGVTLRIRAGEFVAIMGPSGSGKSTLLNILGALDRPTRRLPGGRPGPGQRQGPGPLPLADGGLRLPAPQPDPHAERRENVEVPLYEEPLSGGDRRRRAEELLALVGLADRLHFLPNQLSGGQRQRVAIARALANRPSLILADEPTGNLDSKSTDEIMDLMRSLNREQGTTFIVVTHNPAVARAADRIVTLRDGKVLRDERLDSVYLLDLKEFKESALGHALMDGEVPPEMERLGLDRVATGVREVLERV